MSDLYIAVGSFLGGIATVLAINGLAAWQDKRHTTHVLEKLKEPLKREGTTNRFRKRKGSGTKGISK